LFLILSDEEQESPFKITTLQGKEWWLNCIFCTESFSDPSEIMTLQVKEWWFEARCQPWRTNTVSAAVSRIWMTRSVEMSEADEANRSKEK